MNRDTILIGVAVLVGSLLVLIIDYVVFKFNIAPIIVAPICLIFAFVGVGIIYLGLRDVDLVKYLVK